MKIINMQFYLFIALLITINAQGQENLAKDTTTLNPVNYVQIEDSIDNDVYVVVEDMPSFDGKDPDKVRDYVTKNLNYPKAAVEKDIQGKVFLQFVVGRDGNVKDVKVLRGVHSW